MSAVKFVAAFALVAVVASVAGSPMSSSVAQQPPPPQRDQQDGDNDVNLHPQPHHQAQHAKPSYVIREEELMRKLNAKCGARDVSSCVMLKLVTYMNKLMKKNSLEISDMMEIAKKDGPAEETATAGEASVPVDGSARGYTDESAFGEVMADKLWRYVQSRALKIKVLPEADFVVSASPEQDGSLNFGMSFRSGKDLNESGRGKNKNMGPMMAAMMMKMGMLKVIAFKVLALLVGKALFVSKLAFLLATVIGLKKLFSQQKHVTYEVVAHPHHESHGSDSYSSAGWGRSSSEAAHNMAYSGQGI
ncbi:uncharacterized protein LOC100160620 precursor [Acyrthosiphon pisum]|uniref:ACYPI001904 protein n=1 Tax=Acyrthosiphon pisum TaxID=7029 RepID=C4WXY2_ACYPI|nr:uncharacterized protein LOC100160620 precursor [Acyrthosiphon pisum]BAH72752.1 ACYPI001904 [Acyrthosiphon pisum]|eukprot:NP_001233009.1 uncharacterized protein LOC100160620 precursor [Acyrthosiphon pisum]